LTSAESKSQCVTETSRIILTLPVLIFLLYKIAMDVEDGGGFGGLGDGNDGLFGDDLMDV
jgi:hypothetical protein